MFTGTVRYTAVGGLMFCSGVFTGMALKGHLVAIGSVLAVVCFVVAAAITLEGLIDDE